jgi:TatD DNase family protein
MIDTHAHLYAEQFDADCDEVIARAATKGVERFIIPAIEKASFEAMMNLCARYQGICFPCAGLHPTSIDAAYETELAFVEEIIDRHDFKAVGEIGIDCYWTMEYIEEQRIAFERQLKLASERNLPVIIHARKSFNVIFEILDKVRTEKTRGVFHSFTGTTADYKKIKSYGTFKIGIGGVVTFKNSKLPETLKNVPLTDVVLETDSPYLTPHPFRGTRNESSYLPFIAEKIAEINGVSVDYVDEITTNNAMELFGI